MSRSDNAGSTSKAVWVSLALGGSCVVLVAVLLVFRHLREEARIRFYEAIEYDDVPRLVEELDHFPSLLDSSSPTLRVSDDLSIYLEGMSPIGVAVRNQSRDAFDYLIRIGADVNDSGAAGFPPIGFAAAEDDDYYFLELLAQGADPEIPDRHGYDALHWAKKLNREELLAAAARSKNAEQAAPD